MPHLQRLLLLLTQLAWLLPFAVVTNCGASEVRTVRGWEVYDRLDEQAVFVGVPLLIAALLAVWAWRPSDRPRDGVPGLALRALGAGLAVGGASVGPGLAFLFQSVRPQVGWVLQLGGWGALYLGYLGGAGWALRARLDGERSTEEGRMAALLVLGAPAIAAIVLLARGRTAWGGPLLVDLLLGLPLALLVIGVGRRVRVREALAWRPLAVLLVGAWVLLCVAMALG